MPPLSEPVCPMCRRAAAPAHAPFCSPRCRDRDLLKWLGDGYAIPGDAPGGFGDDEALDNELPRD
jgi:hypothetical protein